MSSENQRIVSPNDDAGSVIVDVVGRLKKISKGRHVESILKRCKKDSGCGKELMKKAIETAKQQGLYEESTFNSNVVFRECQLDTSND